MTFRSRKIVYDAEFDADSESGDKKIISPRNLEIILKKQFVFLLVLEVFLLFKENRSVQANFRFVFCTSDKFGRLAPPKVPLHDQYM